MKRFAALLLALAVAAGTAGGCAQPAPLREGGAAVSGLPAPPRPECGSAQPVRIRIRSGPPSQESEWPLTLCVESAGTGRMLLAGSVDPRSGAVYRLDITARHGGAASVTLCELDPSEMPARARWQPVAGGGRHGADITAAMGDGSFQGRFYLSVTDPAAGTLSMTR